MAYINDTAGFDYEEGDLSSGAIDTIVAFVIVFGQLITIVVLVWLYSWMKKKVK